ncbi:MAG TPA: PP0621 family protein [Candidatus Binatia bacterium]
MLRLILFLFLIYLFYLLVRAYHVSSNTRPRHKHERPLGDEEEMVLDPQCQSYVPKKEAISQAGKFFCSEECAKLYLSR